MTTVVDVDCYYSLSSPWAYLGGPRLQDIVRRHRRAADPQALRLPGRRAAHRRRAAEDAAPAAPALPPGRARPLAHLSRHAAGAGAEALPAGDAGRSGLEQVCGLDGDRRTGSSASTLFLSRTPSCARCGRRSATSPLAEVRRAIADENGYDGASLLAAERSDRVQALYRQFSAEAEKLGVFGAPTYVVDGELFWGQDRLDFVDRKLAAIGRAPLSPSK